MARAYLAQGAHADLGAADAGGEAVLDRLGVLQRGDDRPPLRGEASGDRSLVGVGEDGVERGAQRVGQHALQLYRHVEVLGQLRGEIDGMSYESGAPVPSVSGVELDLGDIIRVETIDGSGDSMLYDPTTYDMESDSDDAAE